MRRPSIAVIDDELQVRRLLARGLQDGAYDVHGFGTAEEALARFAVIEPDVLIADVNLPGLSGLELLERLKAADADVDVVVITGHDDMQIAVQAMKAGAYDYLPKPLTTEQIGLVVGRCIRDRATRRRARALTKAAIGPYDVRNLVGRTPKMVEVYKLVGLLATNRAPALIRGETGTGKELIARAIHMSADHAAEPFVAVNCTALPDTLLESELFGHVRGAFTSAVTDRKGRFDLAGAGTIFLDEIGDTSPAFQSKLLRVLQEREFYPVGGERPRRTEARVIAATHRPIEELVAAGRFREDLYFRLKVIEIRVPPLRERREDIPALAQHLLHRAAREMDKDVRIIPSEAMHMLTAYDWPGNVRELENVLTRAVVLARGPAISPEHLSLDGHVPVGGTGDEPADETLHAVEGAHVRSILKKTGWNKRQTARLLGISRPRLDRIIKAHGLQRGHDT